MLKEIGRQTIEEDWYLMMREVAVWFVKKFAEGFAMGMGIIVALVLGNKLL